jgi:hypothetical protein
MQGDRFAFLRCFRDPKQFDRASGARVCLSSIFGGIPMADDIPDQRPPEEMKKDTVRINLPPGLTGRSATPSITPPHPSPSMRPPSGPSGSPEEEAKKETSVMGRPAEAPKPKKDTSRVQVTAAKPGESPRPTVKLQRDPAPAAAGIPAAAPVAARVTAGASDGGGGGILSLVAMVLSLGVAGFLAYLAFM